MRILNISAYKFVSLEGLPALRDALKSCCLALNLKGTMLLAPEGINLFLAGTEDDVTAFESELKRDAKFAGIPIKHSWSEAQPFGKLLV